MGRKIASCYRKKKGAPSARNKHLGLRPRPRLIKQITLQDDGNTDSLEKSHKFILATPTVRLLVSKMEIAINGFRIGTERSKKISLLGNLKLKTTHQRAGIKPAARQRGRERQPKRLANDRRGLFRLISANFVD